MNVLRDILVPVSLLQNPQRFGGTRDGDCLRGDLIVGTCGVSGLRNASPSASPRILMPTLIEAHCHLDKCHSISRLDAVGGDLAAAIRAQMKDKENWSTDDLRDRMTRGLNELVASGCAVVRSHIDWSDTAEPPLAWHVLHELAAEQETIEIEAAALTSIDQMADADFCTAVAKTVAAHKSAVLGGFILFHGPHHIEAGLRNIFAAADAHGFALDFHVDEGLGDWNGLEKICDAALDMGFEGPVLCGHAVSLMDRGESDFARISDKILRAGIHICALPTTNLYLQGRGPGTPDRRGITRLRELYAAEIPVVVASDNVADAFCPTGQHDPRAALHLASLTAHLDPPMGRWLPAITTDAATALGRGPWHIEIQPLERLRLISAPSTADLVSGRNPLTHLTRERSKS